MRLIQQELLSVDLMGYDQKLNNYINGSTKHGLQKLKFHYAQKGSL